LKKNSWLSSRGLLLFLESRGCEITLDKKKKYTNVYNPIKDKIITVRNDTTFPPFQVTLVLETLEL